MTIIKEEIENAMEKETGAMNADEVTIKFSITLREVQFLAFGAAVAFSIATWKTDLDRSYAGFALFALFVASLGRVLCFPVARKGGKV